MGTFHQERAAAPRNGRISSQNPDMGDDQPCGITELVLDLRRWIFDHIHWTSHFRGWQTGIGCTDELAVSWFGAAGNPCHFTRDEEGSITIILQSSSQSVMVHFHWGPRHFDRYLHHPHLHPPNISADCSLCSTLWKAAFFCFISLFFLPTLPRMNKVWV